MSSETDRQTDRDTHRETETDRLTDRDTDRQKDRERHRQTDREVSPFDLFDIFKASGDISAFLLLLLLFVSCFSLFFFQRFTAEGYFT